MFRLVLLMLANLSVLAGGVVGVVVLQPEPLIGADHCATDVAVTVDGHTAAQPFAFIDLVEASWEGTEESFTASLRLVSAPPATATKTTGRLVYRLAVEGLEDGRVIEARLEEDGWSGSVHTADDARRVLSEDVTVDADGPRLTMRVPAAAFAGLPEVDLSWHALASAPDADTPDTIPAHDDRCATAWELGTSEEGEDVSLPTRRPVTIVNAETGELHVGQSADCLSIAAAWSATIAGDLDGLVSADADTKASDILGPRETVLLGAVRSPQVSRDCVDLADSAWEHLLAAGAHSDFTFALDEIVDFDCDQVAAVREAIGTFTYTTVGDYMTAMRVGVAAERERHLQRCGEVDEVVSLPGADVLPEPWRGTPVDAWSDLEPGDCFNAEQSPTDEGLIRDPRVVPCDRLHEYQVYDNVRVDSNAPYETFEWFVDVSMGCSDEALLERFFEDEQLEWIYLSPLTPTETRWASGDRTTVCTFRDVEGFMLVGDLVQAEDGTSA